jgi:hypothetical protein
MISHGALGHLLNRDYEFRSESKARVPGALRSRRHHLSAALEPAPPFVFAAGQYLAWPNCEVLMRATLRPQVSLRDRDLVIFQRVVP